MQEVLSLGEQPVQITKDECGSVLKIAGSLDISVAEELRKSLCDFLNGPESLVLDLSGVDACDTAGLQLLCSARESAECTGRHLRFSELPEAVLETSTSLGLSMADGTESSHAI